MALFPGRDGRTTQPCQVYTTQRPLMHGGTIHATDMPAALSLATAAAAVPDGVRS